MSARVDTVERLLQLDGMTVLEPGCGPGNHTIGLAKLATKVVAFDPRWENVVQARLRAKQRGVLPKVKIFMSDVWSWLDWKSFDLVFHCGLLYHLVDPVRHLHQLGKDVELLWLNTETARRHDGTRFDEVVNGKSYEAYLKHENVDHPRSSLMSISRWLTEESLMAALADAGFEVSDVSAEVEVAGRAPRMGMLCRRK